VDSNERPRLDAMAAGASVGGTGRNWSWVWLKVGAMVNGKQASLEERERAGRSAARRRRKGVKRGPQQLTLPLRASWGGARAGAGRKPGAGLARVRHRARPEHSRDHPMHVTLRSKLRSLRSGFVFPTVRLTIASLRASHADFRVVQFSVQTNHIHLLVEASDGRALSSGLRSLVIRLALRLNRLLMRRGAIWADRWHGRALTSPRAVRHALVYVLANAAKHAPASVQGLDPCSSAPYFDGFHDVARRDSAVTKSSPSRSPPTSSPRASTSSRQAQGSIPVSPPRTWLLATGWKRHGLISTSERPAS
jgi:putative transposase